MIWFFMHTMMKRGASCIQYCWPLASAICFRLSASVTTMNCQFCRLPAEGAYLPALMICPTLSHSTGMSRNFRIERRVLMQSQTSIALHAVFGLINVTVGGWEMIVNHGLC